jgi:LmbE family N-acetylglucosaminyl deacetylase
VHRVGMRAAELAGTGRVYQLTANRDHLRRGMQAFVAQAVAAGADLPGERPDYDSMGTPESEITAAVDVSSYIQAKRAAMRTHASQISDQSMFLSMPDEAFRFAFGTEWAIRAGQGPGITETDVMAGL